MTKAGSNFRTPAIATALLIVPLVAIFLAGRFLGFVPEWQEFAPKFFLGWIALVFLLTTFASIVWIACRPVFSQAFLGYALLVDSAAIIMVAVGIVYVSLVEILCLYVLLAAWVALWSALTLLVNRLSRPLAAALSMALASICFASPITFIPLVRATVPAMRETSLDLISYATPMLPAFDLLKNSLPSASWPEWTYMYRLSPLGQEIALRSHWYGAAALYAAIAILLTAIALIVRPSSSR
jgi:hypothetical protein